MWGVIAALHLSEVFPVRAVHPLAQLLKFQPRFSRFALTPSPRIRAMGSGSSRRRGISVSLGQDMSP